MANLPAIEKPAKMTLMMIWRECTMIVWMVWNWGFSGGYERDDLMSDDFFLDWPLDPDFLGDVFDDTDETDVSADFFDFAAVEVEVLMLKALALVFGEMGTPSSSTRMMGFPSMSVLFMAFSMSAFVNILAKVLKVWTLGGEVDEDDGPPDEKPPEDEDDDGEGPSLVERSSNSMTVAMFISISPPLTGE